MENPSRRTVIGTMLYATGLTSVSGLSACVSVPKTTIATRQALSQLPRSSSKGTSLLDYVGSLLAPDQNGVRLAHGFSSRIVARSGQQAVSSSPYVWHSAPDGGAIFETKTGGWIYTSNSEISNDNGGVGALVFDRDGRAIDAYSILSGTNQNCAGGPTPWGTWLSCEERSKGFVWECDPTGNTPAVKRSALGAFNHEAVTVDRKTNILYLTEDRSRGLFYRFIPGSISADGIPDLTSGRLQAANVDKASNAVTWLDVPDPLAINRPTRYQLPEVSTFNGGEGIVFFDDIVSFVTKGDNRIWAYQTDNEVMSIIYDRAMSSNPILSGVDNVTLSQDGELVISEDGGDLQIVAITAAGRLVPLVQLVGHDRSEVTGPAFSPDGKRLYFSSQRGTTGSSNDGITFEVTGPFHT